MKVVIRMSYATDKPSKLLDDGLASAEGGVHLLIMSPDSFATLPLPKQGVLTIGRSTRCDVQIEDPMASRDHARLHIGEQILVEDVGSANGTLVRDNAVE